MQTLAVQGLLWPLLQHKRTDGGPHLSGVVAGVWPEGGIVRLVQEVVFKELRARKADQAGQRVGAKRKGHLNVRHSGQAGRQESRLLDAHSCGSLLART